LPLLSGIPVRKAASMREAVSLALSLAQEKCSSVLLSPGGTSFDLYQSYRERGRDFAAVARELAAKL
jgi:UDP-N-acetylmuramoylalanine-D-glutamate ligase